MGKIKVKTFKALKILAKLFKTFLKVGILWVK